MSYNKTLDNLDSEAYGVSMAQPWGVLQQTLPSANLTVGVTYVMKPIAGSGGLPVWDVISTSGINVNNSGLISFTQAGKYLAVFQATLNSGTEYGRIQYTLSRVGAPAPEYWIRADHDMEQPQQLSTHDVGVMDVSVGQTFQLSLATGDGWGTTRTIEYSRLEFFLVA